MGWWWLALVCFLLHLSDVNPILESKIIPGGFLFLFRQGCFIGWRIRKLRVVHPHSIAAWWFSPQWSTLILKLDCGSVDSLQFYLISHIWKVYFTLNKSRLVHLHPAINTITSSVYISKNVNNNMQQQAVCQLFSTPLLAVFVKCCWYSSQITIHSSKFTVNLQRTSQLQAPNDS